MGAYFGNTEIGQMFLGSIEIATAYLGSTKVYEAGTPPTPLPYDAAVEYLQSSGNQYIETGIVPTTSTGIRVDAMKLNTSDTYICGLRETSGNTRWCIGNNGYWGYGSYGGQRTVPKDVQTTFELNYLTSGTFSVDGYGSTSTLPALKFTPTNNIRLFGSAGVSASYSKWTGRIYGVKISQGSNVVMDLIPVRIGTTGYMYDRVGGQLFGNAGTGNFTLGNDINT